MHLKGSAKRWPGLWRQPVALTVNCDKGKLTRSGGVLRLGSKS